MQEVCRADSQTRMAGDTSIPHHHATKARVRGDRVQDLVQLLSVNRAFPSSARPARDTQKNTHILVLGGMGGPLVPSVKVEIGRVEPVHATKVVVELDPDQIKPRVIQCE